MGTLESRDKGEEENDGPDSVATENSENAAPARRVSRKSVLMACRFAPTLIASSLGRAASSYTVPQVPRPITR
ncbi:hypothetical protein BX600DRAFT_455680 [Xylariales sp. PMI_506]|nr:hypothetical protein BX600DRAFT_455680 [Xylariales sp. PMI_506]